MPAMGKIRTLVLEVLVLPMLASAASGSRVCFTGTTDRPVPDYRVGEPMTFSVKIKDAGTNDLSSSKIVWRRTGDDGIAEEGEIPAATEFVYRTSLDRPGFVRLEAWLCRNGTPSADCRRRGRHDAYGCFGAGVDILSIRQAVPEPADFDDFWSRHRAALAKTPMTDAKTEEVPSGVPNVRVYAVSVPCAGSRPMTGFLSVPRVPDGCVTNFPAGLRFYGYNQSWGQTEVPTAKAIPPNRLVLHVSAHGFELMRDKAYYAAFRKSCGSNGYGVGFDPVQNADPEKSYFCGMAYRVMRALEWIKTRPEWNRRDLEVSGGSMGGLQSIWAAALDRDVTVCNVDYPWNCDIGGTEIGRNRGDWYVKWVPALGYYDAVNHAKRIGPTCRVNMHMVGLGDYVCPPTGVFAFYNALGTPRKKALVWQNSGHGSPYEPPPRQMFNVDGVELKP